MKIAVTSIGKELSSDLDVRFGRAEYFIIVDLDTLEFSVVKNKQNINLPQGAGIQAGKTIINCGVDALITGNCGPKAFRVLQSAGIDVVVNAKGLVIDAVHQYKDGSLKRAMKANVEGHW